MTNKRQKLIEQYPINWDEKKIKAFQTQLLDWYDANKRDLPWRQTKNPYYIWVSEIMLQQTQVNTVIPYYERFIKELPTIKDLAEVEESELMGLWQGLGYYSRVRNMQFAAQQVMADFNGEMPNTLEGLLSLKGIGPYTAGAIGSIAFNLPEPALDGNLMRIVARLFEIDR
ncbi:MAG: A/G-specific adenine glycosylase, partial [Ruoffia tabacinasalis]